MVQIWAHVLLILGTTTLPTSTQVTSTLELLLEDGQQVFTTHLLQKRVSIVYPVESTEVTAENFARIRNMQKGWKLLKVFSTESKLKEDLFELLSLGSEYFNKAGSFMKHLLSFTSNSGEKPGTSCIFPGRTLSNNSKNEDSLTLTSM